MSEAAARPGTAQPYADVLQNVGKPSLSAGSDMPEIDLAKPGQGDPETDGSAGEGAGIDAPKDPKDTGQTSGDKPEGEADGQPKPKGEETGEGDETPPWLKARITRADRKAQAATDRATALETQVAKLTEAVTKLVGDKDTPKEDPRPARDAFDNPDAYDQALESWVERRATEKATVETEARLSKQQQDGQRQALVDAYKARETAFQADHPDFEDSVYADDVKITPAMTQAILEAEDGPAIAYHLGQNPEVAERIAGLSPAQQVTELGRISVKLATPPPKPKPEPIRPLNTRNTAGPKDPADMNMDEYAEFRRSKAN